MVEVPSGVVNPGLAHKLAAVENSHVPDALKKVDFARVKKVDDLLSKIPQIDARGAVIEGKPDFDDASALRESGKIQVGKKNTDIIDYVSADEQVKTMLQEGMRLGVVEQADFKDMGIDILRFTTGLDNKLEMLGRGEVLSNIQKAEAIGKILNKAALRGSSTMKLFLDRMNQRIIIDPKVRLLGEGAVLDNQDLLNALVAAGNEQLDSFIIDSGFQQREHVDVENQAMESVMNKLVKKVSTKEGFKRNIVEADRTGETTGKNELSAIIDKDIAYTLEGVLLPPTFQRALDVLNEKASRTTNAKDRANLLRKISIAHQKGYAALLNAFAVVGYEEGGEMYKTFDMSARDQMDVVNMGKAIRENPQMQEYMKMSVFDANRHSLTLLTSDIAGIPVAKLAGLTNAFPIESTVAAIRRDLANSGLGDRFVDDFARDRLAADFINMVYDAKKAHLGRKAPKTGLISQGEMSQLRSFFLKTYDTERQLIVEGAQRENRDDHPAEMLVGDTLNHGVKFLDSAFHVIQKENETREGSKTWEEYIQTITESAKELPDINGAQLRQDQPLVDAENLRLQEDATKKAEELHQQQEVEAAIRLGQEEAERVRLEGEERVKQAAEKVKQAAEKAAYDTRTVEQSLEVPNDRYGNEVALKIHNGDATSEQISQAMERTLGFPSGLRRFRGLRTKIAEVTLKTDPGRLAKYNNLKDLRDEALQAEEEIRQQAQADQERADRVAEAKRVLQEEQRPQQGMTTEPPQDAKEQLDEFPDKGLEEFFGDRDLGKQETPDINSDDLDVPTFLRNRR